ncbi:c-type cytochrome, partial [Aliarcobacter butzleri]|nr:c-type cytochrome [Aliarcobacter butzleri]
NQAQMEANILAKLEQKKQAEEKAKIEKEVQEAKVDAQNIYVNQCQTCHGAKGEVVKAGVALNSLSVEDMQSSLKDYELGRNGKESSLNAAIHTSNLNSKTIKGIYAYLKDLNNPSKK